VTHEPVGPIGYYVHHRGAGHSQRALTVARALGVPVVGLSSVARPAAWMGEWITLPLDTDVDAPADPTANGRLHWAPLHSQGLSGRLAAISAWIESAKPSAIVVDVSVEVALLARLHGIPVVTVALPGNRADSAHLLGFDISSTILGAWPAEAQLLTSAAEIEERLLPVGAISRFPIIETTAPRIPGRIVVLRGRGGAATLNDVVGRIRRASPNAKIIDLGADDQWLDNPEELLRSSSVIISHCGQNAVAEIAATRSPAILVAEPRPHDEQLTTAAAITRLGLPAVVVETSQIADVHWGSILDEAAALDGSDWARWCDGEGANRAAEEILRVARMSS
jgi:hypothetical protein